MNIISMNMDYKLFPIMACIDKLDLWHAALTCEMECYARGFLTSLLPSRKAHLQIFLIN